MSTSYSPRIVTDGLKLYYDVNNIKSYPGEPTTNIVTDPLDLTTGNWSLGNDAGDITITGGQRDPFGGTNAFKFECTDGDGTSEYPHIRQNSILKGTTASHKFSVYLKWISGEKTLSLVSFRQGPGSDGAGSSTFELTDEGVRYECTCNPLDTSAHTIDIIQNAANASAQSYLIAFPQMEQKSHVTPFVDGTRSATDGMKDLSGNNNDGDFVNGLYDSNAEITYNGGNGINMGNPSTTQVGTNGSIEAGVYPTANQGMYFLEKGYAVNNSLYLGHHSLYASGWGFGTYHSSGGGYKYMQWGEGTFELNKGHHVVITFDKSLGSANFKLYHNGVPKETYTGAYDIMINSQDITIGNRVGSGRGGYGKIPIIKIYDTTLSAKTILDNFNAMKGRYL